MARAKLAAVLACAALIVAFAAPRPIVADAAQAKPTPTPTPTPTPSPPPHGLSCTDGTNGPGWIDGVFAIPNPSDANTNATTAIAIFPDTDDARTYLAQYAAQLQRRRDLALATAHLRLGMSQPPSVLRGFGELSAQGTAANDSATTLSQLLQRLQPTQRGTTVDGAGNWACHGLTSGTYLMLATTTASSLVVDPNATPIPMPMSSLYSPALLAQIRARAGRHIVVTTYSYRTQLPFGFDKNARTWETKVPFDSWIPLPTVVQSNAR